MILRSNGIDIYYIDESHDSQDYVVTAVAVPMLRPLAASFWQITWPDYFEAAKNWRKVIRRPVTKLQNPLKQSLREFFIL